MDGDVMAHLDPRERDDGLGWATRAVFGGHRHVRLWVGRAADVAPDGWKIAARYAIAPSVDGAKFLMPVATRAVLAASVLAYNALRPWPVRLRRAALGNLARLGVISSYTFPTLQVAIPIAIDARDVLLTDHLAAELGDERLHAAIGVRQPDPNYKPTLQLFDGAGRPRGYAKVGWNDATRALVRAESHALENLPRAASHMPRAPRLLVAGQWADRQVALVEPLPHNVRRLARPQRPRSLSMLAVARRGEAAGPQQRLEGCMFMARLEGLATEAVRGGYEGGQQAARLVAEYRQRYGHLPIELGHWHGDWVPWNLATRGRTELYAWDWEHSGTGVPVGFDLAHHAFQVGLILEGKPAAESVAAVTAAIRNHGAELGLVPDQYDLVVDGYLLELWFRTWRLAAAGAGWNRALHPALLRILDQRLSHPGVSG